MANDSRQLPSLMNLDRVQNATLSLMPDASSKLIQVFSCTAFIFVCTVKLCYHVVHRT